MKLIKLIILVVGALIAVPALAQDKTVDTDMQILREKVRADKKLVVAANMELTESQAKGFWPIYDDYQKEIHALNDRMAKAILAYADGYNNKTLTDDQAMQLTNEAIAIDQEEVALRKKYASRLGPVLPAKLVARYIQIESKIRAAMRYDLASSIPLVQ